MSEHKELWKVHRPTAFNEVVGQDAAVKMLKSFLKSDGVPHALLFTGDSGCGKSTLAHILAKEMGCKGLDLNVINCATTEEPINAVREMQAMMRTSPSSGSLCRIWVLEECFPPATQIDTPQGPRPISSLQPGDTVWNVAGCGTVEKVFKNTVPLNRVVRITFDDGTAIYTTKNHRFLTDSGWVEAQYLGSQHCILCGAGYTTTIESTTSPGEFDGTQNTTMCDVSGGIHSNDQGRSKDLLSEMLEGAEVSYSLGEVCDPLSHMRGEVLTPLSKWPNQNLLQEMRLHSIRSFEGAGAGRGSEVPCLWEDFSSTNIQEDPKEVLQPPMRKYFQEDKAPSTESSSGECRRSRQEIRGDEKILAVGALRGASPYKFQNDDGRQPIVETGSGREDAGDQRGEGYTPCVARESWGQRTDNSATKSGMGDVGGRGGRMGDGSGYSHGLPSGGRTDHSNGSGFGVSQFVQGRCGEQETEGRHRGRWEQPSIEKRYVEGCQKDPTARKIRVASVEGFEPGRNEASFSSVITTDDCHRGFVEFYDLQVSRHPSFFVEGIPVHNCQSWSRASFAQQALLVMLEDASKSVKKSYFFFCTTNPEKLKEAIRNRCTEVRVQPLRENDMRRLLLTIAKKEDREIPEAVLDRIIYIASGSARDAVNKLGCALALDDEEDMLAVLTNNREDNRAWKLLKSLFYERPDWKKVSTAIREVGEAQESFRHAILKIASTEMLKGGRNAARAYLIADVFSKPWFDCAESGLTRCCWEVVKDATE